ncbi:MAG: class I SAM-dependent methyltransferase [Ardenticatenaceae bacterium]
MDKKHGVNLTYEARYKGGYGLMYPDGHVIRFHRHILEYELGMSTGKMLDYGCGNGTHLLYFNRHGFIPYGCDINKLAVGQCKQLLQNYSANLHQVPNVPQLSDYFEVDFDLVFSNQTLYFLNDADLSYLLAQFYKMLRDGGVFFATMMADTNYYSRFVVGTEGGLSKVVLRGRLNHTTYINFKTKDEVLKLFTEAGFTKLHLGFYTSVIREDG